jgi:hypothetical protein
MVTLQRTLPLAIPVSLAAYCEDPSESRHIVTPVADVPKASSSRGDTTSTMRGLVTASDSS